MHRRSLNFAIEFPAKHISDLPSAPMRLVAKLENPCFQRRVGSRRRVLRTTRSLCKPCITFLTMPSEQLISSRGTDRKPPAQLASVHTRLVRQLHKLSLLIH